MLHPKQVDPNIREYIEYFDHIRAYNKALQHEVSRILFEEFKDIEDGYSIATVGSDARLEKGPASLVEVMLLTETNSKEGVRARLEQLVTEDNESIFEPHIEKKIINDSPMSETVITLQDGSINITSPNRVFDANLVFGDEMVFHRAKSILAEELNSERGKTVYKRLQDKTRHHRGVTLSGKQRYKSSELEHYNFEEGVAHYSPNNNLWSIKQGPLRYLQFMIARDAIRTIREGKSVKELLYLPSNTVDKLNSIEVHRMSGISSSDINDLTDNYKYFLWQYHRSQSAYRSGIEQIGIDGKEAKERCKALVEIGSQRLIKPVTYN